MIVTTPEVLWHGGGLECGKPDPVLSVDIYGNEVLATSGIDANVPPKGSVRLWKISKEGENEFLVDLSDHQSVINAVRFSPCGRMIASASDRQIVVYYVPDPRMWATVNDPKMVERIWLRPCLQEIYDLEWSPDSVYVIAGSIDSKGEILRATGRDALSLRGHSSYVQGVAWDPMNKMVVTQSADRSCRVHQLKHKGASMVKLAPKGLSQIRMLGGGGNAAGGSDEDVAKGGNADATPPAAPAASEETAAPQISPSTRPINLFADSTVPCFFRRPAFSPDGSLLVAPTGISRTAETSPSPSPDGTAGGSLTYSTHIFQRGDLQNPAVSLVGLEDPSVAVRFSPVLYSLKTNPSEDSLFEGPYRMVFAVMTTTAVLIYDTQHAHPLAYIGGCHLASINDAAWSADGKLLVFCSSDGYVTFVRFDEDSLGSPLPAENVPEEVKNAFKSVYLPPLVDTPQESAADASAAEKVKAAPAAASTSSSVSFLQSAATSAQTPSGGDEVTSAEVTGQKRELERVSVDTSSVAVENIVSSSPSLLSGVQSESEAEVKKKKRRIAPVMVSPGRPSSATSIITTTTTATIASSCSEQEVSSSSQLEKKIVTEDALKLSPVAVQDTLVATAAAVKKVKKRIAPVHVGDNVALPQLP